jgi:hypothetical protein
MRRSSKTRRSETVELRAEPLTEWQNPFGSEAQREAYTEARMWREYALAGIFPRSIPEYIPDDVIAEKIRECEANNFLPWEH